jgi:hypothetical protein
MLSADEPVLERVSLFPTHCGHGIGTASYGGEGADAMFEQLLQKFEQLFQKAVAVAARVLFAASLVMFIWGIVYGVYVLSNFGMTGPSLSDQVGWVGATMSILALSFAPAAQLFFGAVIVHYLEIWAGQHTRG